MFYLIGKFFIIITLITPSKPCLPNYIPDVDKSEEDISGLGSRSQNVDNNCECGIQVDPHPWHVLIQSASSVPKICGGSIINDISIITSISCLIDFDNLTIANNLLKSTHFDPERITIYTNVKNNEPLDKTKGLKAASIHCHFRALPTYMTTGNLIYDVCMIQLAEKLNFQNNSTLSPVCIPDHSDLDLVGRNSILLGWNSSIPSNSSDDNKDSQKVLQKKESWIYSNSACGLDNKRLICTQHGKTTDIFLFENFGSPVMVRLKSGRLLQVGISSFKRLGNSSGFDSIPADFASNLGANELITFINEHSKTAKARWCKQPKIEFHAKPKEFVDQPMKSSDNTWEGFPSTYRKTKSTCHCGIRKSLAKPRIVGGQEVPVHEYGWQVQLLIKTDGEHAQGCGGTIINSKMILTASHCVAIYSTKDKKAYSTTPTDITLRILKHTGFTKNDKNTKTRVVAKVYSHPNFVYSIKTIQNDIALLELKEELDFESDETSPVCLPTSSEENTKSWVGKFGTVIGYGLTNQDDPHSTSATLRELDVPIHDHQKCVDSAAVVPYSVSDKIICAGYMRVFDYKDPSHGDSGGPLMIPQNIDPKSALLHMVQIGIVSAGTYDFVKDRNQFGHVNSTALWYSSVPAYLSYIHFFSYRAGATWCSY